MNEQISDQGAGRSDGVLLGLAIVLVLGGVAAFYVLSGQSGWLRWLSVVVGIAMGVAVFAWSQSGRNFWQFVQDSRNEMRKVFWPSRQETMTTTLVVFVFVIVAGLFFWGLDVFLAWATKWLTGQGG